MSHFLIVVKGLLIGIANVIPGVSGGTFALVLGIYDRLINALKSFDLQALKVALRCLLSIHKPASRASLAAEIRRLDLVFLMLLTLGALIAIKGLAGVLQFLLSEHPTPTLAFFVGLIIPSIAVPARMMQRRGALEALAALLGVGLTLLVSMGQVSSDAGAPPLWLTFFGGAIAIAAMILPGISGSFVLLVIGLYQPTLEHIHHITGAGLAFLAVMAAGFAFGLVTVSRLMAYLLKNLRSLTLAFLIGLIFGSFWVLWPFKDYDPLPASVAAAESTAAEGESSLQGHAPKGAQGSGLSEKKKVAIRVATAPNRLPRSAGELWFPGLMLLLGLAAAMGVNKLGDDEEPAA